MNAGFKIGFVAGALLGLLQDDPVVEEPPAAERPPLRIPLKSWESGGEDYDRAVAWARAERAHG